MAAHTEQSQFSITYPRSVQYHKDAHDSVAAKEPGLLQACTLDAPLMVSNAHWTRGHVPERRMHQRGCGTKATYKLSTKREGVASVLLEK